MTATANTNSPAIQIISVNQASGITLRLSGAYYTRNEMMSVIMKAAYQLMAAFKHTRWALPLGEAMSKAFAALRQAKKAVAKEAARMAARQAELEQQAAPAELAAAVAKSGSLKELMLNVSETEGYQNWVRRNGLRF